MLPRVTEELLQIPVDLLRLPVDLLRLPVDLLRLPVDLLRVPVELVQVAVAIALLVAAVLAAVKPAVQLLHLAPVLQFLCMVHSTPFEVLVPPPVGSLVFLHHEQQLQIKASDIAPSPVDIGYY